MRSYGQYCSVAKALDVIGDRWTLLIVRELLLRGACRYTDPAGSASCSRSVVLQAGSPLARRRTPVACTELARLPLIAHAPSRAHVEEQLRTHGVDPRFVLQAETGSGVQGLVAAGLGAGGEVRALERGAARRARGGARG